MKSKPVSQEGWVYLIHAEGTSFYKIGVTSGSVMRRLDQLQTGCPHRLYVVDTCLSADYQEIENLLHQALIDYRQTGEWFDLDVDLVQLVQDIFAVPGVLFASREKDGHLYSVSVPVLSSAVWLACQGLFPSIKNREDPSIKEWEIAASTGDCPTWIEGIL